MNIVGDDGKPVIDETFLLLVNAHHEGVEFTLPQRTEEATEWSRVVDTNDLDDPFKEEPIGGKVIVGPRSLMLLCERNS